MKKANQLSIKFTLTLGEKEETKTKKIFYGSLLFIFLSVLGSLASWFLKLSWQKLVKRLKIDRPSLTSKVSSQENILRVAFLLLALNLGIWGWLNRADIFLTYEPLIKKVKEISFPVALGKTEEGIILGAEDAVKIDDLQKEPVAENSLQKALGAEKNLKLSLTEGSCQRNKLEGKSSELCGQDGKDEVLEKELKKIDDQARAKMLAARKPVARKISCAQANDHPSYSDTKGKHTDEDCCPDPDEYPQPGCVYSPAGYALMLKR